MAYNLLKPFKFLDAQAMATSFNSRAIQIDDQDNIGIQLAWTGTPSGSFTVEVSLDHVEDINGNIITAGTWVTLSTVTAVTPSGAAGNAYINISQLAAPYLRVAYTASSGAGSVNAYIVCKGV